ncbi:acetylxylan esterase [Flexithrix dorotheae]|uniref:acetylxylan esterase n=1 Tax=Flexithrix dorotheae TaxID=70993 RepID=UPI00037305C8|nr:acetylxylan esterase [Flexithrix dorotheae]
MKELIKQTTLFTFFCFFSVLSVVAQPKQQLITVNVAPTQQNWTYALGERADFEVKIIKNGQLLPQSKIRYSIGLEKMEEQENGELLLKDGSTTIKGIKINKPGFLRCKVSMEYEGKEYTGWGTAGFAPEKIEPTVPNPDDFDEFWEKARKELSEIPMDANVTLVPEQCTPDVNVYHVSLQSFKMPNSWRGISRFYGMLSVPKQPGKYPAILGVPGAGIRPYGRDDRAAKGVIVFKVGIHGIPVNLPEETYLALGTGALSGYQNYGLENRDKYYYKRVYMGCVRAIDFIYSLPEFDGENLAVTGGSQGGALSIITAGLDKRIKYLAAFYPALSDVTGYLHERAGGWPHMFTNYDEESYPNWVETVSYYDVVNFARRLTIPGWYSWGYNDNVCPPTSMHAAYNVISSPKELHKFLDTGHWTYPEQGELANKWLFEKLGVSK